MLTETYEMYPNNDMIFTIKKNDDNENNPVFGWKFMSLNKKLNKSGVTFYKKCLGVFICEYCNFCCSSKQPKTKSKKTISPMLNKIYSVQTNSILKYI